MSASLLQVLFKTREAVKKNISLKFMLIFASLSGMANVISNQRETILNYFFVHFDQEVLFVSLLSGGIILVGSAVGAIKFYLESGLFYLFGKVLGGSASFKKIQTAISFYYVPLTISLFLLSIDLTMGNGLIFLKFSVLNQFTSLMVKICRGFWLIRLICSGWGLIILTRGIAEVQDFSLIKAIANLILVFTVIFSLLGLILK